MKTRIFIIILLLFILGVLLTRNDDRITSTLLNIINPIKQHYKTLTQEIEEKGKSYLFQQASIERLSKENMILRKKLLEQTHYIKQIKDIYEILPRLSKLPVHNIALTNTISYIKLNSFSQIMLTKPKGLQEGKIYGLIQKSVVAGVAKVKHNQLYGYLTSDPKCRFSVFIGKEQAPGIAMGLEKNHMVVKFIPKWHKIKEGDKVVTSGLDHIFFANLPVGIVARVEIQSAYKIAHIKTYADIFHPKVFFLIQDPKATLTQGFDRNITNLSDPCPHNKDIGLEGNTTIVSNTTVDQNSTLPEISSIPDRIDQTQAETIEPEMPQEITESPNSEIKPKSKSTIKKHSQKRTVERTLDLF